MKLLRLTAASALLLCTLKDLTAQPAPPRVLAQTRAAATARGVSKNAATRAALGEYFRKAAGLGFSGAVLVARGDEVLMREGYGWADVKRRVPVTPETVFDIGSGVKAFTATAVLQLEERGRLATEDPISKHLTGVPPDTVEVIGTSPLNQQGVQTFVRLKFEKAEAVYRVTWRDGRPRTQPDDRLQPSATAFMRKSPDPLPINLAFLPQSARDFATYDLFRGRTAVVSLPGDGRLIVRTKDGDAVARKVAPEVVRRVIRSRRGGGVPAAPRR